MVTMTAANTNTEQIEIGDKNAKPPEPANKTKAQSPSQTRHLQNRTQLPVFLQCSYLSDLGEGSYGKVYLVMDKAHNQIRAVKAYKLPTITQTYRDKFVPRELDLLLKVSHPNVIGIHRMCKAGSFLYMVMDYADGKDLEHYIHRGCTGVVHESQARHWIRQIANALEYLHTVGVVHRDLKCENILITTLLNAKLADFGFARLLHSPRELSNTFCGTSAYAAPEILKNIPYNPRAADIWSLGVVLFRILNKTYPFGNSEVRNNQRIRRQEAKEYVFNRRFDISAEARQIISRMLEPNPRYRVNASDVQRNQWIQKEPTCRTTVQEAEALKIGKMKVSEFFKRNPVVKDLIDLDTTTNLVEEYKETKYPDDGESVSEDSILLRVCQNSTI